MTWWTDGRSEEEARTRAWWRALLAIANQEPAERAWGLHLAMVRALAPTPELAANVDAIHAAEARDLPWLIRDSDPRFLVAGYRHGGLPAHDEAWGELTLVAEAWLERGPDALRGASGSCIDGDDGFVHWRTWEGGIELVAEESDIEGFRLNRAGVVELIRLYREHLNGGGR